MKYKIEFEGDYYEDFDELRRIVALRQMDRAIHEALNVIRKRFEREDPPKEEEEILERLRDILYIPEIDS